MAEEQHEKTCADCKCRTCSPITAMMERIDAWKASESLLHGRNWNENTTDDVEVVITPSDVLLLSNWLLYGPDESDD